MLAIRAFGRLTKADDTGSKPTLNIMSLRPVSRERKRKE